MRVEEKRAVFIALAALYDLAAQSQRAPLEPSLGLRALLAFLFIHARGNDAPFVGYWRECQSLPASANDPGYDRRIKTTNACDGIARALGLHDDALWHRFLNREKLGERKRRKRGDCGN